MLRDQPVERKTAHAPQSNQTDAIHRARHQLGLRPRSRDGPPGHTLGGRVLPGYSFPATEGSEPIAGLNAPQPTQSSSESNPFIGDVDAMARAERTYRGRCVGCHKSGGGSGPNLFGTTLEVSRFVDKTSSGVPGTTMPAFGSLLTNDQILELHAFVLSRSRLN